MALFISVIFPTLVLQPLCPDTVMPAPRDRKPKAFTGIRVGVEVREEGRQAGRQRSSWDSSLANYTFEKGKFPVFPQKNSIAYECLGRRLGCERLFSPGYSDADRHSISGFVGIAAVSWIEETTNHHISST